MVLEERRLLSTYVVRDNSDNPTDPGSLRYGVDHEASGTTIEFAPNVTGTITLTHGTLDIKKNLDIIGPGAANLTISGDNKSRVFLVADDVKANISSLTISRGKSGAGGGVVNQGNLTLSSCIVSDNNALYGGGLYNYSPFGAKLHLSNCAFTRNTAAWGGGMATLEGQRETVIDDCTFSDNSAYSEQGGGGLLLNGFVPPGQLHHHK